MGRRTGRDSIKAVLILSLERQVSNSFSPEKIMKILIRHEYLLAKMTILVMQNVLFFMLAPRKMFILWSNIDT